MNEMKNKKYHTTGTIPKWPQQIPHYGNNSKMATNKYTTLWEQSLNGHKKYHIMGTIRTGPQKIPHYGNYSKMKKKINTIWKEFQNEIKIPHYGNNSKYGHKKYHTMETIPK